jgi:predicted nucleic acid-binding protein
LDAISVQLHVSAVTVAELSAGVLDGPERQSLDVFLTAFHIVPVDQAIAVQGGLFRRDYGKSHGVGLADAIIAASAVALQARLVTLNQRHFPMLPDIEVPYQKP